MRKQIVSTVYNNERNLPSMILLEFRQNAPEIIA